MTQKEIDKFLANTKVYVAGKSKEIQEKLFSLGYEWNEGGTDVNNTEPPFLYIHKHYRISYGCDMCVFIEHEHREISVEEILSLELSEPDYRPFKSKEECWKEMHSHSDFGWVTMNDEYYRIDTVWDDNTIVNGSITINGRVYNFNEAFEFRFTDNLPFGIKEDSYESIYV